MLNITDFSCFCDSVSHSPDSDWLLTADQHLPPHHPTQHYLLLPNYMTVLVSVFIWAPVNFHTIATLFPSSSQPLSSLFPASFHILSTLILHSFHSLLKPFAHPCSTISTHLLHLFLTLLLPFQNQGQGQGSRAGYLLTFF